MAMNQSRSATLPTSNDAAKSTAPIRIYTDGCALGNPGRGGYGVIVRDGESETEWSQGFWGSTNNRMELMAVLDGLRTTAAEGMGRKTIVESDSKYVVNAITLGWLKSWVRNDWNRVTENAEVKNIDLWKEMVSLLDGRDVELRWVKGHSGNKENEHCDKLAKRAARLPQEKQEPDVNYEYYVAYGKQFRS